MTQTQFCQTTSYATALPAGRGPSQGRRSVAQPSRSDASSASTLDGVAAGKIIARVKWFRRGCPLFFFLSCLNPLTHSGEASFSNIG